MNTPVHVSFTWNCQQASKGNNQEKSWVWAGLITMILAATVYQCDSLLIPEGKNFPAAVHTVDTCTSVEMFCASRLWIIKLLARGWYFSSSCYSKPPSSINFILSCSFTGLYWVKKDQNISKSTLFFSAYAHGSWSLMQEKLAFTHKRERH